MTHGTLVNKLNSSTFSHGERYPVVLKLCVDLEIPRLRMRTESRTWEFPFVFSRFVGYFLNKF